MKGFGEFLLLMSERLDRGEADDAAILDCLNQINEAWQRKLDPATDFESYAMLRLCQSIQRILEQASD